MRTQPSASGYTDFLAGFPVIKTARPSTALQFFRAVSRMATKREGGLSSDALRQSLGPPVRIEVVATGGGPAKKKSKPLLPAGGASSKPPGGYGGSRHSMAMGQSKRPLSSQQQRRQTHVVGSSRVSAGR